MCASQNCVIFVFLNSMSSTVCYYMHNGYLRSALLLSFCFVLTFFLFLFFCSPCFFVFSPSRSFSSFLALFFVFLDLFVYAEPRQRKGGSV